MKKKGIKATKLLNNRIDFKIRLANIAQSDKKIGNYAFFRFFLAPLSLSSSEFSIFLFDVDFLDLEGDSFFTSSSESIIIDLLVFTSVSFDASFVYIIVRNSISIKKKTRGKVKNQKIWWISIKKETKKWNVKNQKKIKDYLFTDKKRIESFRLNFSILVLCQYIFSSFAWRGTRFFGRLRFLCNFIFFFFRFFWFFFLWATCLIKTETFFCSYKESVKMIFMYYL